MEPRLNTT